MTGKPPDEPAMIGLPPSARGLPAIPADKGLHAQRVAREWRDVGQSYAERRMMELGIPKPKIGADDPRAGKPWRVFDPDERTGGSHPRILSSTFQCAGEIPSFPRKPIELLPATRKRMDGDHQAGARQFAVQLAVGIVHG
jgi:hypothetical protein